MNIVPIDQIPTEVVNTPVDSLMDLYKVCQQMEKVCTEQNGIGLSAVQVGLPWKFFIYQKENRFYYMVDCEYEPIGDEKAVSVEGCLSLRSSSGQLRHFKLERHCKVRVTGQQLVIGADNELKLENVDFVEDNTIHGVVCQHEIDHHRGILISELGKEINLEKT